MRLLGFVCAMLILEAAQTWDELAWAKAPCDQGVLLTRADRVELARVGIVIRRKCTGA